MIKKTFNFLLRALAFPFMVIGVTLFLFAWIFKPSLANMDSIASL